MTASSPSPSLSKSQSGTRYHHLDALRGLAALAVALSHTLTAFSHTPFPLYVERLLGRTPVLFFFVLSGFVLSRSLGNEGKLSKREVAAFLVRRFFRLYPVLLISLIAAFFAVKFYTKPEEWSPANDWLIFNIKAAQSVSGLHSYINTLLLRNIFLNPPVWTIQTELFSSFCLPFMVIILKRVKISLIPVGLILLYVLSRGIWAPHGMQYFMFCFYLGYFVCTHGTGPRHLTIRTTQCLILASFVMLIFVQPLVLSDVYTSVILAALLAILIPCNWPKLKKILNLPFLQLLGRVSFSFYLANFPIIILGWLLMQKYFPKLLCMQPCYLPALVLFFVSSSITLFIAILSERWLERFWNALGHRLAKKCFLSA